MKKRKKRQKANTTIHKRFEITEIMLMKKNKNKTDMKICIKVKSN